MISTDEILDNKHITFERAAEIFDSLKPVDIAFMIGRWRGSEVWTDHQMVGYLTHGGWYGKLFTDQENVHPLLFWRNKKGATYSINPKLMPFTWKVPKAPYLGFFIRWAWPLLRTRRSRARLSMVEYRGHSSAAMVYDQKPIIDHFRQVDQNCLMGAMNMKGAKEPYFFVLRREQCK